MATSNSLGFRSEIVSAPRATPSAAPCDIESGTPPSRLSRVVGATVGTASGMTRSNMLCCALTSLLVAAGVGVGVWFAVTEL